MIQLSENQQKIVDYTGFPILVAAGAGSGKTRTLIAKFAHLVKSGLDPSRILAITFTNKTASEMKTRLVTETGIKRENIKWVRTYHSACLNILKNHYDLVGLKNPVQIYTTYHQQNLIKKLLTDLNFNKIHTKLISNHISNAKNTGSPKEYFNSKFKFSPIPIAKIYKLYELKLLSKNALDFDNILLLTRNLLRDNKAIRLFYKNFFQYILCDEYQDTNNLNEEITKLLLNKKKLFAVGDDWQSIYSFRMSNIDHFMSFIDNYPEGKIFRLEENYRSVDEIVKLGNSLISFNKSMMSKLCYSKKKGGVINFLEFYTDNEEASWIIKKAKKLNSLGVPYESMAILYRTKFCSLAFEKSLRKNNVPYHVIGSKGFFEKMEILDINSYISAAFFEKDDISLLRIINIPKRGIGQGTLKKLANMQTNNMSLRETILKAINEKILTNKINTSLINLIELLNHIKQIKPEKAILKIIHETNYINYIKEYTKLKSLELASRFENIEQIIYLASKKNNIKEYLEETALIGEDKENDKLNNKGINLSTVHRVKGLEFSTVFISGCEEELFPHWKSMKKEKDIQEERRLMYVAITRAEKYLFFTYANFRKGHKTIRSRFLDEINNNFYRN